MQVRALYAAATVLVAGCQVDLQTTVYLDDLRAVIAGATDVTAPATLSIEAPSSDECRANIEQMAQSLRTTLPSAAPIGCRGDNLATFATFSVNLPIVLETDAARPDSYGIEVVVTEESEANRIVAILAQRSAWDATVAALPSSMRFSAPDAPEIAFQVTVHNDLADLAVVQTMGAYVDGQPLQLRTEHSLPRRGQIIIDLSDVGNSAAFSGGAIAFFLPDNSY